VWKSRTVGISLEIFKNIDIAIGVAGGEKKAEAIIAVTSLRKDITLVTDEAAANKIINIAYKATK
jgi:Transcriptional regulator, contains sigma factor-related N-terminal domain